MYQMMSSDLASDFVDELPMHFALLLCGIFGYMGTRWANRHFWAVPPRTPLKVPENDLHDCLKSPELESAKYPCGRWHTGESKVVFAVDEHDVAEVIGACADAAAESKATVSSVPDTRTVAVPKAIVQQLVVPACIEQVAASQAAEPQQEEPCPLLEGAPVNDRVARIMAKKAQRKARKAQERLLAEQVTEQATAMLPVVAEVDEQLPEGEDKDGVLPAGCHVVDIAEMSTADEGRAVPGEEVESDSFDEQPAVPGEEVESDSLDEQPAWEDWIDTDDEDLWTGGKDSGDYLPGALQPQAFQNQTPVVLWEPIIQHISFPEDAQRTAQQPFDDMWQQPFPYGDGWTKPRPCGDARMKSQPQPCQDDWMTPFEDLIRTPEEALLEYSPKDDCPPSMQGSAGFSPADVQAPAPRYQPVLGAGGQQLYTDGAQLFMLACIDRRNETSTIQAVVDPWDPLHTEFLEDLCEHDNSCGWNSLSAGICT